jgi:hypothetical protein
VPWFVKLKVIQIVPRVLNAICMTSEWCRHEKWFYLRLSCLHTWTHVTSLDWLCVTNICTCVSSSAAHAAKSSFVCVSHIVAVTYRLKLVCTQVITSFIWDLRFSRRSRCRCWSSGLQRSVILQVVPIFRGNIPPPSSCLQLDLIIAFIPTYFLYFPVT